MQMKKLFYFLPLAALFTACTQDVTIDLPVSDPKIVVEGGIENGSHAWVVLSKSVGYFSPVDSATLANNIIADATVIVSDGLVNDTLHLTFDPNFTIPLVYKGSVITGQAGQTYTLTVKTSDGKTVTSTTTIHQPLPLDSTWFKIETHPNLPDSLGFIWAHMTEPAGMGNAYRWYAKRMHKDNTFLAPIGSAFDDKFVDGKSFDFAYNRGEVPGSSAPDDNNAEAGYFKVGDTVVVKFASIGHDEFEFYRTFETEVANNGNPFAAPGVIRSNINGGLGVWCGFGVALDTVIAH